MLHEQLAQYLAEVERSVNSLKSAYFEHYEEEIISYDRINLRIRIRFSTGHLLEIYEAVVLQAGVLTHLGYRYHFQDEHHRLVFRYDNTPHFPNIRTFPHHKHLSDKIIDVERPSIREVIDEVERLVK